MSIYVAVKTYQIPSKTLERRLKNNDKKIPMEPTFFFAKANEKKVVNHIFAMQVNFF